MSEASQPLNALPQGYRLQEYELVRVLGFGDFGMTYLGFLAFLLKLSTRLLVLCPGSRAGRPRRGQDALDPWNVGGSCRVVR